MHVHIYENSLIDIAYNEFCFRGQLSEGEFRMWQFIQPLEKDVNVKPAFSYGFEKPLSQRQVKVGNWKDLDEKYGDCVEWETTRSLIEPMAAVILDFAQNYSPLYAYATVTSESSEPNTASSSAGMHHLSNPVTTMNSANSSTLPKLETSPESNPSSSLKTPTNSTTEKTPTPTSPNPRKWKLLLALTAISLL